MSAQPTTTGARRQDRKAELADAAALLFAERGYHQVGIDDIAAEVGITGGAVYRHYRGKRDLLSRVMFDHLAAVDQALDNVDDDDPHRVLSNTVEALVELGLEQRIFTILANREHRNLTGDERERFDAGLNEIAAAVARRIHDTRPGLDEGDCYILSVAVLAVCSSPAFHASVIPSDLVRQLLHRAATAIISSSTFPKPRLDLVDAVTDDEIPEWRLPTSTRERLVDSAIELFGRHGYSPTRMEDIGASAGIAGPSIYEHFPSKADLLVAAVGRGAQLSELAVRNALAGTATPREALRAVVASYIQSVLDHPLVISVLLTEVVYLPDADGERLRRIQRDYIARWVRVLQASQPTMDNADALFLVHCALAIINRLGRMPMIRTRGDAAELLVNLGVTALGVTRQEPESA